MIWWNALYRKEGLVGSVLSIDKAIRLLEKYLATTLPTMPEYEERDWIRPEAEAAMCWPFQSPAVDSGPYGKVDIGAGTTHASLFRIFGNAKTPNVGMAFFGAVAVPVGMDAVDRAITESEELGDDCLKLRGLEAWLLEESATARGALIPVVEQIYEAYRKAWIETHRKIRAAVAELTAWNVHKLFVIGGGSLVQRLVDSIRVHPGLGLPLELVPLEQPPDLISSDGKKITESELPFVTVAYGLSNIGFSVPEAFTPNEVPPMPDQMERRKRLDHEDIYAK